MDLMSTRRRILANSEKKDYLKGVEWVLNKFITGSGSISSSAFTKYMRDSIFMIRGVYVLVGTQSYSGTTNYRIHQYDENDKWVKQLQVKGFGSGDVSLQIVINEPMHIRLSISRYFEGTLTKA